MKMMQLILPIESPEYVLLQEILIDYITSLPGNHPKLPVISALYDKLYPNEITLNEFLSIDPEK